MRATRPPASMGNEQSNKNNNVGHALPLIRIVNNKMDIVASVPKIDLTKTKVVSILGKARMGKSTFLNAIVSKINCQNKNIFQTKDDLDHCTRGIDYYYLANENMLLLDSQGLAHEDSRHDPALLLFVYLVSDVIVFNDRMMLQNEALSLLQPICTFMNYVDLEDIQKPKLIFRISDGDMVKDTSKNLQKLLATYPDQYQSIRESIGILFEKDIHLVRTNTLDCVAREFLEANDYMSLLEHKEMGFHDAVESILKATRANALQKNPTFRNIKDIVEKINNNEKIKVEKLDVVGLTARTEIQDWILAIDNIMYSPIEVDGTQKIYEDKVEFRKNQKKQLLKTFTMRFKTFPLTIREPYYADLQKKLEEPIRIATEESITKAKARVLSYYTSATTTKTVNLDSSCRSFSSIEESSVGTYFPLIERLSTSIQDLYEPVKKEYENMIKKVYNSFKEALTFIKKKEEKEINFVTITCQHAIDTLSTWLRSEIDALDTIEKKSFLEFDNKELFTYLSNKKKKEVSSLLETSFIVKRKLDFTVKDWEPTYEIHNLNKSMTLYTVTTKYDLIVNDYTKFETFLHDFMKLTSEESKSILDILINMKKKKLHRYLLPSVSSNLTLTRTLVEKNRDCIEFVRFNDTTLGNIFTQDIMTRSTYNTYFMPIITETFKALIKSGYMKNIKESYSIAEIRPTKTTYTGVQVDSEFSLAASTPYTRALTDIFLIKLKKTFCKAVVKGWKAPAIWGQPLEEGYVIVPEDITS